MHVIASTCTTNGESCAKYAGSSWSGGGVLLGLAIVAIIIIVVRLLFFRSS